MRPLRKVSATLFLAMFVESGSSEQLEKRGNVTLAAPIVAVPSEHWYVYPRIMAASRSTDGYAGKESMGRGVRLKSVSAHLRAFSVSCL